MKKFFIASIIGLAMQVSVSEAQTSPTKEVPVKKQYLEPPPPPPPPPEPPAPPPPNAAIREVPPAPPVPPVPPIPPLESEELIASNPASMIDELHQLYVNEKGYDLSVRTENKKSVVIVRREGKTVKKIELDTWLANNKMYEDLYGKLPPPPPPVPRAPQKDKS